MGRNAMRSWLTMIAVGWILLGGMGWADNFAPETIRIGRVDIRDEPFSSLAGILQQASGRKVVSDPTLVSRDIFLSLQNVTLAGVLEVALPSQGATWELGEGGELLLSPLPSPWPGPRKSDSLQEASVERSRQSIRSGLISLRQLTLMLSETYKVNCIGDFRVEQMPLQALLPQATLEETLESVLIAKGLQWSYAHGILLILPSDEAKVLNFPCPIWKNWAYDHIALPDVMADLAKDLGFPIRLSARASEAVYSGIVGGKTVREIFDLLSRQNYLMYGVSSGVLYMARRDEANLLTMNATLPDLKVRFRWWSVPSSVKAKPEWKDLLLQPDRYSPAELETKLAQLASLSEPVLTVDDDWTLKEKVLFEKDLAPASSSVVSLKKGFPPPPPAPPPPPIPPPPSGARYRFMDGLYALLTLQLQPSIPASAEPAAPLYELPGEEGRLIRFDRPLVAVFTDPKAPGDTQLLEFHFQFGESSEETAARPYKEIRWYIPRGYTQQTDLTQSGFYREFPGSYNDLFLSEPFRP